ncbi:hypothetical protein GJ496_012020 [Pomphorhynchus laevis]|nr:hypothetical protein GJ496_012020 [Pomphorhynchus laevis]
MQSPTEFDRHELAINVKKAATTFEDESRNAAATNTLGRQLFEKYVTKKCCDTGPINLNKQHLKVISEIRQIHDVVIKPSDKGGEAVVWSRSEYIAEAMRHLSQVAYQTATIDDLELAIAAVRELLEKHASLRAVDADDHRARIKHLDMLAGALIKSGYQRRLVSTLISSCLIPKEGRTSKDVPRTLVVNNYCPTLRYFDTDVRRLTQTVNSQTGSKIRGTKVYYRSRRTIKSALVRSDLNARDKHDY